MTPDNEPLPEDYYIKGYDFTRYVGPIEECKGPDESVKAEPTEQERILGEADVYGKPWALSHCYVSRKLGYVDGANATRLRYIESLKELIEIAEYYNSSMNFKRFKSAIERANCGVKIVSGSS